MERLILFAFGENEFRVLFLFHQYKHVLVNMCMNVQNEKKPIQSILLYRRKYL